jgi:hypothetical protein
MIGILAAVVVLALIVTIGLAVASGRLEPPSQSGTAAALQTTGASRPPVESGR